MNEYCGTNIFKKCNSEELAILYEESKLYNHIADIPETSSLYKYIDEFLRVSEFKSYAYFCLQICRACIDNTPTVYPYYQRPADLVNETEGVKFQQILDKRVQEIKNKRGKA